MQSVVILQILVYFCIDIKEYALASSELLCINKLLLHLFFLGFVANSLDKGRLMDSNHFKLLKLSNWSHCHVCIHDLNACHPH